MIGPRELGIVAPYLLRPIIWPELARLVVKRLFGASTDLAVLEAERLASENWCAERAIAPAEAARRLNRGAPLTDVKTEFSAEIAAGEERAAACPVKLGGAGNLDLLYTLCDSLQAMTVVETGVAYGWSSLALLLSLKKRPGSRLFSVDLPYFEYRNDRWVGIVVPDELRPLWKLYRMADREGLPRALRASGTVDLAHYDSDKSVAGRHYAYPRMWDALRPGGILISDDIADNQGFQEFCETNGLDPMVVARDGKYQGIIVKPES